MRAAGVEPIGGSEGLGILGFVELIPRLRAVITARRALLRSVAGARGFVGFDGPDLLLGIACRARSLGVPAVHVVSPQVWAWRPGRVATVARSVDALACLFPFEPALYAGTGLRAVYTGHPLAVRSGPRSPEAGVLGLLPGSRRSEIRRLWPVLRQVARRSSARRFLVAVPPEARPEWLDGLDWERAADVAEVARRAERAVVASGTATLEVAAHGCPQVVVAGVHPLTAWVARRLVRTPYVALPNVLAGAPVVAEHVQDLDPGRIVEDLHRARPVEVALRGGDEAAAAMADLIASVVVG
jgi:lipid-A-disaccharide synthase